MIPRPKFLPLVALLAACGVDVDVQLSIKDARTGAPIPDALVAIEQGGIYQKNDDPSIGNPSYQKSAIFGADGLLRITDTGPLGIHVFANGYRYRPGLLDEKTGGVLEMTAEPELPEDASPTAANAALSPAQAAPGAEVTLEVDAAAGVASDPLSEEVLVLEPTTGWGAAMDPPSAGIQGKMFPDGRWRKTFEAPEKPGTYTYFVVVSSEGCVTSDRISVQLTVK